RRKSSVESAFERHAQQNHGSVGLEILFPRLAVRTSLPRIHRKRTKSGHVYFLDASLRIAAARAAIRTYDWQAARASLAGYRRLFATRSRIWRLNHRG